MNIPSPREKLAGCVWLPRILAKARLLKADELPPDYAARFCHPTGVDAQFLAHFSLTRDDILAAADWPEPNLIDWFQSRSSPAQIEAWNQVAVNLGRPGFPMADRVPLALATSYKHINPRGLTSVFDVLEADDKCGPPTGEG